MKLNNIKENILSILVTIFLLLSGDVFANATTAQEGLDKIKSNLENSKANLNDHKSNLAIVNSNISEVSKAKVNTLKQKETVNSEILKNNEGLKKVILLEKELQQLINQETQDLTEEAKKVQELTKILADLEETQKKRQATLEDYKKQMDMLSEEKVAWKNRESVLREQENATIISLRNIASTEVNLSAKKKSYESEVSKWNTEVKNQQKIYDSYQGLKSK